MPPRNIQQSGQTRLFLIEDAAGAANIPRYQFLSRGMGLAWPQGGVTPVRIPDPNQYGRYITADKYKGQQGLPSLSVETRMTRDLSDFLAIVKKGCPVDLQFHSGQCQDPRDFNGGWDKIYVLESAEPTDYGTGDLGAFDGDQNTPVVETVPFTGADWYEIGRIAGTEIAGTEIVQEIVGVAICDSRKCGECGLPSDGCNRIFAVTLSAGGSPGLPAELIASPDGGLTIVQRTIVGMAAAENPAGLACVGAWVVVIATASAAPALFYAPTADILNSVETWTKVTTGFVATKVPRAIFSLGTTQNWIVGDGGYIYYSEDITAGVTVQSAGGVSVQNLAAIHGIDELNLVAVGASNTVLVTNNGGSTWTSLTGPAVGVNMNAVWMKSETEWLIGTASGKLWYTRNAGTTWTEKTFPGSGSGVTRALSFSTNAVGYMSHDTTAARGRILRTINGGYSWYVLPEAPGQSLPLNDKITALAACAEDPNFVIGGGLADNAIDGYLVKVN